MKKCLLLTLLFAVATALQAEPTCKAISGDADNKACIEVKASFLQCNESSSTKFLSSCIATIRYQASTDLTDSNIDLSVGCDVELNYLKSVMGIRDTNLQHAKQAITLAANGNEQFEMPMIFNFATQTEASNAAIKAVNCRIDTSQ